MWALERTEDRDRFEYELSKPFTHKGAPLRETDEDAARELAEMRQLMGSEQ